MAVNDMVVRIIGDSRSVERAFARSSNAATQFNRNVETTGKKVDRQARTFASFGKGVAAGFGGAVAFNLAVDGIRSVVNAAAESQQVLGQTQVALAATGQSWEQYGQTIERTIAQQSRLGFDDEALLRTFSQFVRTTNDVGRALDFNNLAMDVARARFIDLEQAAQLVNKAALGNAGALRRLGIDAKTGASSVELLALLTDKYGGSAAAAGNDAATAFERSKVSAENAKEALGAELLPAVIEINNAFAKTAEGVTEAIRLLKSLGNIKIPEIEIPFVGTFGGGTVGPGPSGIDIVEGIIDWIKGPDGMFNAAENNRLAQAFRDETDFFLQEAWDKSTGLPSAFVPKVEAPKTPVKGFGTGLKPTDIYGPVITQIPLALQEALLDAERNGSPQKIRAVLQRIVGALNKELTRPDLTAKNRVAIKTIINSTVAQIEAIDQATADAITSAKTDKATKAAAAKAAAVAQAAAEATRKANQRAAALAREQARQFRAIGLGPEGVKPPPGIENLLKQASQLAKRTDLSKSQRGVLAAIRKVLLDPVRKATPETRDAIKNMFDTWRQAFNQGTKDLAGPLSKTMGLNTNQIVKGLGLTPDAEREIRARLASFNSAGVGLAGARRPTGSFRGGIPVTVVNENTITLDGDTVARNTTISQQKTRRRNPVQKRGSRRGGV